MVIDYPMSKKILVIDDDASIISIFEFILKEAGFRPYTATSGDEGLAIYRENTDIDLVFLDVKMPGLSGIDTYKAIKECNDAALIVMMTGYSVDELLKDAFELGAYGVIYKPFDVEEVLSVIDKIFKLPARHPISAPS